MSLCYLVVITRTEEDVVSSGVPLNETHPAAVTLKLFPWYCEVLQQTMRRDFPHFDLHARTHMNNDRMETKYIYKGTATKPLLTAIQRKMLYFSINNQRFASLCKTWKYSWNKDSQKMNWELVSESFLLSTQIGWESLRSEECVEWLRVTLEGRTARQ